MTLFSSIKSKLYFATAYTRRKYFYFFRLRKNWRNKYLVQSRHFFLQKRILILFKSNNLCTTKITILFSFQIFITSFPLFPQINSLFANSKNWRKNSFSWILRIFMKTLCLKKNLKVSHFLSQIKQKFSSLFFKKKIPFLLIITFLHFKIFITIPLKQKSLFLFFFSFLHVS